MSVQTSIPGFEEPPHIDARLTLRGRLAEKPHVANLPIDSAGQLMPVLVLKLRDVGAGHNAVTAHVPYPPTSRDEAEREAKRLKRDQLVEVESSLVDIRVLLPAASFSLVNDE